MIEKHHRYGLPTNMERSIKLPMEILLPADPQMWTKRDVQNWLCWIRETNDLDQVDITDFNTDGPGLCNLSKEEVEGLVGARVAAMFETSLTMLMKACNDMSGSLTPPFSLSPQSPQSESSLQSNASPKMSMELPYQTPCTMPTCSRSSIITSDDIARLQPIAPAPLLPISPKHSPNSAIKKETRKISSEDDLEDEEENDYNKYFLTRKQAEPKSNGIDCGRQGVTLWQFILELLSDKSCSDIVTWTENHLEFKVINSKEMAQRWGARKNRPKMNYDKLSRALRYYYRKNLIQHVPGKRQVYFFVEHPESLDFTQLLNNALRTHPLRNRAANTNSAFTHVGNARLTIGSSSSTGIKRSNIPSRIDISIKKQKKEESQLGSTISTLYPTLSNTNSMLSLQSPLLPSIPGLSELDKLDILRQQSMMEYQRLAALHQMSKQTNSGYMPLIQVPTLVTAQSLQLTEPKASLIRNTSEMK